MIEEVAQVLQIPEHLLERDLVNSLDSYFNKKVEGPSSKFTPEDHTALIKLMEQYQGVMQFGGIKKWFIPGTPFAIENCPKHKLFFDAGRLYSQRVFMAANRAGKSVAGAYELSCHLTGDYPEWWDGHRFKDPVSCWAVGKTGQTTRDTVQKELMGDIGAIGTGTIPKDRIVQVYARPGVPNGIDTVLVRHISGGNSSVGIKSYDQDIQAFYGTAKHCIWMDEECPELIYNECLIRTMTTEGIIYVTFTPLHNVTPFIINFDKGADHLAGAHQLMIDTEDSTGNCE